MTCRVCGSAVTEIYGSASEFALTSSATIVPARTNVDYCACCGHVQTQPIGNLATYYSSEYKFRAGSFEEDDLCTTADGRTIFRSELQAELVERKLHFGENAHVLDYGSGKGRTLRLLLERHRSIRPYVFDVSDAYRDYWNEFVPSQSQASFELPQSWLGRFDAVLSFFALEHVENPAAFVRTIRSLLQPDGTAIAILPNMYRNACDFLVVDHVNHFSRGSIARLFRDAGFSHVSIDSETQPGWYVLSATGCFKGTHREKETGVESAADVAAFWKSSGDRIRAVETERGESAVAIYGSGIYGLFIANTLQYPERIACFLDRNPFRQGLSFLGAPVLSPEAIPDEARFIYVGLNPEYARESIAAIPQLAGRDCFFFPRALG